MDESRGVVLFGDVVALAARPASRDRLAGHALSSALDDIYGSQRLAAFEFTQGDEIQGLLAPGCRSVPGGPARRRSGRTRGAARHPGCAGWPCWAPWTPVGDRPPTGPGDAFLRARALLEQARDDRDGLLCRTGDP